MKKAVKMKIDMEREFFKAAKNVETYSEAKKQFMARINEISEEWINKKSRLGILGLKENE